MPPFLRNTLAVLAGIVAGGVLISAVELINVRLYPMPPGLDPTNAEQMKAYAATLPAPAFFVVLAGYLVGITTAVFLATKLAASNHARRGVLVAAFFGAGSVMNLRSFEHPSWFWPANFVILVAALWIGLRLGLPRVSPAAGKA